MDFAAVSLALLDASAVQGLATPTNYGSAVRGTPKHARDRKLGFTDTSQPAKSMASNGVGAITVTLEDLVNSLTGLTTETIGSLSDTVNSALGTVTDLIVVVTDAALTISKRKANPQEVIDHLNTILDRLQVRQSINSKL